MTSGTAQRIALNLFPTPFMIELGRIYDGLMVHIVATNAKLVRRSQRIVEMIAGRRPETAAQGYEQAERNIPLTVLLLDGLSLDESRERLQRAVDDLRKARDVVSTVR